MRSLILDIKENLSRLWYGKKSDKEWQRIRRELGNPGIAWYVKKEYYNDALKFLAENGKFHDPYKPKGILREFIYKDFEYKNEITNCDFSKEVLNDNDIIVMIRVVDKSLSNKFYE